MLNNSSSDFLPPIQVNEFLPPISRWTTLGGLFIVSIIGLAIPIASVAKYKETVKAQASIRPIGGLKVVQAATEGSIVRLFVKENQVVKTGEAIALIDDSRLQTKKSQLQSNIQQAQLQLVQINAQIQALNNQIKAETDRANRAVASAKAELSQRQRDYRDKQTTSTAQVQEAEANVGGAQEEAQKAQAELKSAQANLSSTEALLKAAGSKQNRYQSVAKDGALPLNQLEEAQLEVERQEQAVKAQKAAVEAQKQAIEQLQQTVKATQAKRQGAASALNPTQAEVAIASERIAQEKATGEATLATLSKERESLSQKQIETSKQLERDRRELQQVKIDLSQTTITATAEGIISKLNLHNSGQTVRPGEEIAQIVPKDAPLEVKAAVLPQDIGKLEKGQKVQMQVSACPYPDYGTLKGAISQISEDTLKAEGNNGTATAATTLNQKEGAVPAFYEVTIKPESLVLGKGKNQCVIQLGMEGRADIISREETFLKFLLRKARLTTGV